MVLDSLPDKERTLDHAFMESLDLEILSNVPGCPLGYFNESDDLMAHLLPLFAIGSEFPTQLVAFLNKLFQLGIHPGDLFFADRLDGDGLCLGPIMVVTEGHHTF